jgi:uncharacterized protein (DUF1697 family)
VYNVHFFRQFDPAPPPGQTWFNDEVNKLNDTRNENVQIPKTSDGTDYKLEELNDDQFKIAFVILAKIKEWIKCKKSGKKFEPLRMTVCGMAGTGKSRLVNTLVSVIRTMFNNNNTVHVATPTGASAYNVGGRTIHSLFKVGVRDAERELSERDRNNLGELLDVTIALFFDERSMISQKLFGATENNISQTAHGCGHSHEEWGGIPIVVIFGDDYQLPSIEAGAFDCFNANRISKLGAQANGKEHFKKLGRKVMYLQRSMRQKKSEKIFLRLLKNVRRGKTTKEDIDILMSLHLGKLSKEQREEIISKATFIFANKEPMRIHNMEKLKETQSKENPVARISAVCTDSTGNKYSGRTSHFKKHDLPFVTTICRGAKVQITGRNLEPSWGLYNGSVGTVVEIIYNNNESPLDGILPQYVIVEFQQYCGPCWDKNNPKWVPIPIVQQKCDKGCCEMKFVPLSLAFAKTGHTFQGQSVGEGHPIPVIIVQPGNRRFEGNSPGLFYVFLSRATDIGTAEDRSSSAIFFFTADMNEDRVSDLLIGADGKEYQKVRKRKIWVDYLKRHVYNPTISKKEKRKIIKWAKETTITDEKLKKIINTTHWRQSNELNY